jgi:TfoX/Sxy family transcriptional regulator of competence genes
MPKPSAGAAAAFTKLVPADPAVTVRPMFGNVAAFVNGNMFSGLFGDVLFVRLSDADAARLRADGGGDFAPMPGRPMKAYTTLPPSWQTDIEATQRWVATSLEWTRSLPVKAARPAGGATRKR